MRSAMRTHTRRAFSCVVAAAALFIGSIMVIPARSDEAPGTDSPPPDLSKTVAALVEKVSEERLAASMKRLGEFHTRHTYSEELGPDRGIGAARRWIAGRLEEASDRMQVSFDTHRIAAKGPRLVRDLTLHNVVGVLPASTEAGQKRNFVVSAHYDSIAVGSDGRVDWTDLEQLAPGVNDDGSGTAVVMEAARVMADARIEANIVFIAFAGEEQGLVGSSMYARAAKAAGMRIDGVLNNDIVGGEIGGDGRTDNRTIRLFSQGPGDSPSRELARFIHETGGRYLPSLEVDLIFRQDRFGRGGDHISFNQDGYAGVRFTVSNENYSNQHTVGDTFEASSPAYAAKVARLNIAALASLALAPPAPIVSDERGRPTIDRGETGYDTRLRWRSGGPAKDLAGYRVLMRETTSPTWQHSYWAGLAEELILPEVSIDRHTFGVRAVDRSGHESLAGIYVFPARPRIEY